MERSLDIIEEGFGDLNILESFLVERFVEDDDSHEYMEALWVESERKRREQPLFNLSMEPSHILKYCIQYFKSVIEMPKIILDNIRYILYY